MNEYYQEKDLSYNEYLEKNNLYRNGISKKTQWIGLNGIKYPNLLKNSLKNYHGNGDIGFFFWKPMQNILNNWGCQAMTCFLFPKK